MFNYYKKTYHLIKAKKNNFNKKTYIKRYDFKSNT